ncbi:DNA repair protein RadC [Acidovorax sp. 94]|jgi:DNA repair protein RadC|nr:Mov34/MPN/PAD-1 family protein [Acidovorax sp. sif0632]MBV7463390.1 Mov34/MPN/PAD-1 family protein [Acidovorax sp. sif0613]RKR70320.1 DNA repair protein RadC [Acidovorax sp. 94]
MSTTAITRAPRRPAPLQSPKAGEPIRAYGLAHGSNSLRRGLRARERAVIDRALCILGSYLREPGDVFDSPDAVKHYLMLHLAGEPCEHFAVLYLDSQNRGIAFERHFAGTLAQATVYPREIAFAALQHGAAAVVLAHNHPSGSVQPSRADEALTQTLKQALALVGVCVLDHVIVGGTRALSMAERGLM